MNVKNSSKLIMKKLFFAYFRLLKITLAIAICSSAIAQQMVEDLNPYANETPEQHNARMKWWREARFGMFIHWGVYSVPAGIYKGKRIDGIGEWIMHNARIPVSEYKQFAKQFNPVKYNPDYWVQLAKEAGMKYIVITSKHHDGFALFDSKVTDWDVVDATPYGKDLLKPLAEACQRHGIKLGFYYSQAQDWNHPGGAAAGGHWDPAQDGSMDDYIRNIAVPQVKEILSNYGPIAILWWDTPVDMTKARADMLIPLIRLQPNIIINNRLGGGYHGDTETPEQYIPATGFPGRDFEVCMTMNDTWGYKSYDNNWKSTETLVRNLIDIASKGGNYLLNVGPTSEGLIPEPSVVRLKEIGKWMKINGEAIYGTTASPFKKLPWGRCTKKTNDSNVILYLHVFNWPSDGKLIVPGLKNQPTKACLLADPEKSNLSTAQNNGSLIINLPGQAPDPISSTIMLVFNGPIEIESAPIIQSADGTLTLSAADANLLGQNIQYESGHDHDNIGFWTNPSDKVEWKTRITQPGKFNVEAITAATGSAKVEILFDDSEKLVFKFPNTGNYTSFTKSELGQISINKTGDLRVVVQPIKTDWTPLNLRAIKLTPVK